MRDGSPSLFDIYRVADRLGGTVVEIGGMAAEEFEGWMAYLELTEGSGVQK